MKYFVSTLILILTQLNAIFGQRDFKEIIPSESIFVGVLKGESFDKKLKFEKIDEYSFIETFIKRIEILTVSELSFLKAFVLNFDKNGINPVPKSYVYAEKYDGEIFLNFIININDYTKFKAGIDNYSDNPESLIVLKNKYFNLIKNNSSISWQKEFFIYTTSLSKKTNLEDRETYESRNNILLNNYSDYLCSGNFETKISELEQYNNWENHVRVAGIWVDYSKIIKQSIPNMLQNEDYRVQQALNLISSFTGEIYLGSEVTFEEGIILSESRVYCSEQLIKLYEKATRRKANKNFFNYIDPKNYGFYNIMYLSPEGVYEGYKNMIIEGIGANLPIFKDLFGILEIFIDEKSAFNFIKGDFFVALNNVKSVTKTDIDYIFNPQTEEYESVEKNIIIQNPMIALGFSFGKKKDIMKFIRIFSKLGFLKEDKKNLYQVSATGSSNKFYLRLDRRMLILSNDQDRIVRNKKYPAANRAMLKDLNHDFYTFNMDINNLIKIGEIIAPSENSNFKKLISNIDQNLKKVIYHAYKTKKFDKFLKQDLIFEIKNKDKNPLQLIFDSLNEIYLSNQKGM
jgi:hypothetical protein